MKIGYARVSTDEQDSEAQHRALLELGCEPDRIYFDEGRTGGNRDRGGLIVAMAACRHGDHLVVSKLDRLARSVQDFLDIADELVSTGRILQVGTMTYDPQDALGKMFFQVLAVFAEFERDLLRARTREGMAVAKSRGRLKGKQPKLTPRQDALVLARHESGSESADEIARSFNISRAAIYRSFQRARLARADGASEASVEGGE